MTLSLADEIRLIDTQKLRDVFNKIAATAYSVPDAITPIRHAHVKDANVYMAKLEKTVARLERENHELRTELASREQPPGFTISHASDAPSYVALERARIDRLNADDQRAAGQRECL